MTQGFPILTVRATDDVRNVLRFLLSNSVSLVFSLPLALILQASGISDEFRLQGSDDSGEMAFFEAASFALLTICGSLVIWFLYKKRYVRVLRGFFAVVIAGSTVMLFSLYGMALAEWSDIPWLFWVTLPVGIVTMILNASVMIYVTSLPRWAKDLAVFEFAVIVAAFTPFVFGALTLLVVLWLLCIHDIYSVHRGPIRVIMKDHYRSHGIDLERLENDQMERRRANGGGIEMGLGDLVFHASLSCLAVIEFGAVGFVLSVLGILFGSLLTLRLLHQRSLVPGLPLPILFGSVGYGLAFVLLELAA